VFGPRQDPNGPYAAVIPRWIAAIRRGEPVQIYGDGKTSRDFCYVDNAVQANLLAGLTRFKKALNQIYNVACGYRTSLNELYDLIDSTINNGQRLPPKTKIQPSKKVYLKCRKGDIRHSLADISKARNNIGYNLMYRIQDGVPQV
jgi:UDP-N-acetylglucosamine 4-epimerase